MAKKEIAVGLNLLFPGIGQFYLKRWFMGTIIFLGSLICLGWLLLEMYCLIILNLKNMLDSLDTVNSGFQLYKINIIKFATAFILLIFLGILSIVDAVFFFKNKKNP